MSNVINLKAVRQREGARLTDRKALEFVAMHGCAACGHRPVQVHHLLHPAPESTSRGMGRRASDNQVVPLCLKHHQAAHADNSFEEKHHLIEYAALLWKWYNEGLKQ